MDSGEVCRRPKTGRRVRPGSMIASRMQVFEAAAAPPSSGGGMEEERKKSCRPLFKARSMMDLVGGGGGGDSGGGRREVSKATPMPAETRGVVCNPSTGQAIIPRVSSTTSLLTCIRATAAAGGHTHKPRPQPTPPVRGGSTSSNDSDYSTGSQHSPPRDEDPCNLDPPDNLPQTSPTTGARGGGVGSLKQFFEKTQHTPLSRASSLPHLTPTPPSSSSSSTPFPHHHPHKVPVILPQPVPGGGRGLKSSTLPTASCLRQSPGQQSPGRQSKLKTPLLPPPVKHVRIIDPRSQISHPHGHSKSAVQYQKKLPLLPPLAARTPVLINSSSPPSTVPPPKPPRAPNRLQLHNISVQQPEVSSLVLSIPLS